MTVLVLQRVKNIIESMELLQGYYHENSLEFVGSYWALKGHPASSQGGSPRSSPLRSDGSRDDQAGEAGPVEHSSAEAKSLKLKAKGLSGCHPSGQQPRQPDGEARGRIKDYTHIIYEGNAKLKAALTGNTVRQKAKRRKTLTLCSNLENAEGDGVGVDEVGDE